jgi:peptidoglycan/xylan/chitin deacetylase (PgdA/CDA1 family)
MRSASHLVCVALLTALAAGAQQATHPKLALTFDDLPAHGPLPPGEHRPTVVTSILATIRREHLPPVYGFVNGFRLESYPYQGEILAAWADAHLELGNHTWSHPELDKLSATEYEANIERDEPTLRKFDPQADWHWFRYPFLEEGNTVAKREAVRTWLFAHGYRIAEISMDFQDYNWNDAYARCADKHDEKAIAHLHDTYLAAAAKAVTAYRALSYSLYQRDVPYILLLHVGAFDARMMPELIAQYRAEGFSFVSLPEAESDPAYAADPRQPTPGGNTFFEQVAGERKVNVPPIPDYSEELDKTCR